jgi:hypothetical protein
VASAHLQSETLSCCSIFQKAKLGKPRLSHKTTNSKRSSRFQLLSLLASPSWSNRLMSILLVPLGHSKRLPGAVRPFVPLRGLREFTLCRGHDSHVQTMFVHADRRTSCSTLLPFPPPIVEFRVQRQTRGPASTFPPWSLRGKPLKILRVPSQGIHRDPPTVPLIINIQHHHR